MYLLYTTLFMLFAASVGIFAPGAVFSLQDSDKARAIAYAQNLDRMHEAAVRHLSKDGNALLQRDLTAVIEGALPDHYRKLSGWQVYRYPLDPGVSAMGGTLVTYWPADAISGEPRVNGRAVARALVDQSKDSIAIGFARSSDGGYEVVNPKNHDAGNPIVIEGFSGLEDGSLVIVQGMGRPN